MAKRILTISATVDYGKGETYDEFYSAHSIKEAARKMRRHIKECRSATNFVFTITRVSTAATPDTGGDVE